MRGTFKLALLFVGSALMLPTAAQADESNSVRVSYADLNLGSDAGRQTLQRRIAWGARTVCVIEDSKELALASETKICRGDAVARAQPAYNAAVASFLHPTVRVLDTAALVVTSR